MTGGATGVRIGVDGVELDGDLAVPPGAKGLVIFAHGTGSSRHSPRNRYVADMLGDSALGTLLVDLLTSQEEEVDRRTRHLRFDVGLLAGRLVAMVEWLRSRTGTGSLDVGLFGASTGAAAALMAAARRPDAVAAVVSRGGRPDLAGAELGAVRAPTLLLVGEMDPVVLDLNQRALEALPARTRLDVVPGASHLFEEPGALEDVARLARDWFLEHLGPGAG